MANKAKQTWSNLLGPVCIFLNREWKNGQLVEVKKDHVVYSISGDSTQYIITKDETYHIIRKHNNVTTADKTGGYTHQEKIKNQTGLILIVNGLKTV